MSRFQAIVQGPHPAESATVHCKTYQEAYKACEKLLVKYPTVPEVGIYDEKFYSWVWLRYEE